MDLINAEVEARVNRIFAEADVNNDGAISQAEFLFVMTGLDFHLLDVEDQKLLAPGYNAGQHGRLNNSYDTLDSFGGGGADLENEEAVFSNKAASYSLMVPTRESSFKHYSNTNTNGSDTIELARDRLLSGQAGSFSNRNQPSGMSPMASNRTRVTPVNSPINGGLGGSFGRASSMRGSMARGQSEKMETHLEIVNANSSSESPQAESRKSRGGAGVAYGPGPNSTPAADSADYGVSIISALTGSADENQPSGEEGNHSYGAVSGGPTTAFGEVVVVGGSVGGGAATAAGNTSAPPNFKGQLAFTTRLEFPYREEENEV
jgi:hypothetical protein